jgi:GNAT superfamily N-acetyltransferase
VLFRKRPAYRYTVKHSIYIHHAHVGGGVGRLLLGELIDVCAAAGFRQMIGYIDADNATSLALHEKFGFSRVKPASSISGCARSGKFTKHSSNGQQLLIVPGNKGSGAREKLQYV